MKVLDDALNLDEFWPRVATAPEPVLLLDYDGTLAPFRKKRDRAIPYAGIRERFVEMMENCSTRIVIISGRAIDHLLPLLGLNSPPEIWGSHGMEFLRPDGTRGIRELSDKNLSGFSQVRNWIADEQLQSFAEHKPAGIAFHWRGLPETEAEALRARIHVQFFDKIDDFNLEWHAFDGGLEIRVSGISKADAVSTILDETDEVNPIAFLGDDHTDEDGFRILKDRGLPVLVRKEFRETQAKLWIKPPDELYTFLDNWRTNTRL